MPLCGKSLDLQFLWQKGHEVTGVEGVANAIPAFVQESGVQLHLAPDDGTGLIKHQTSDGRLTIIQDNFLELSHPSLDHQFNAVWDRASLYALSEEPRQQYMKTIRRLLGDDFRYILATLEYDESGPLSGPPHSIPLHKIEKLFGDFAVIEKIDQERKPVRADGLVVHEVLYLLTPRKS